MGIDNKYKIVGIPAEQTKYWLLNKHYAKRRPSISYAFGLYDKENCLQGVCTFGTSLCSQLQGIAGNYKVIELNRLVINENLGKNVLSYFVSQSLKLLPKPLVVISYSDSEQGHHGYIYQATNFIYTGVGAGGWGWAVRGKENMHHTSVEDSVGRYEDRDTSEKLETLLRKKYGDKLYKKELSSKHRYIYFLGNKKQVKEMRKNLKYPVLKYPKGDNIRYDASYKPTTNGILF